MNGRSALIALFGLFFCCAGSMAAPEGPRPVGGSPGKEIWELTSYLKGTPAEVRDLLNGEVERLSLKRKGLRNTVAQTVQEAEARERATLDAVRKSPAYVANAAEVRKAEADLALSRKAGTTAKTLEASSRFNALRGAGERMERDGVAADAKLVALRKYLAEQQANLKASEESLAKAQKWRDELMSAVRVSFELKWPMRVGSQGVLGKVTPLRIVDGSTFTGELEAREIRDTNKGGEGLQTVTVIPHKVRVRVAGMATADLREGTQTQIDLSFTVAKRPGTFEDDLPFELTRTACDVDRLFDAITVLRLPADEAAPAVAGAAPAKKANPKVWNDLTALLAAAPADARPRRGEPWTAATLQRMNDWLSAEIVGDSYKGPMTFESAGAVAGSVFELRGRIDVPVGPGRTRPHTVVVRCPATLAGRAAKLTRGQRVNVAATFRSLSMLEDDTTLLDLAGGSF